MERLIPQGTEYAPPAPKCCENCALRKGSQERSDPYEWLARAEHWSAGGMHICHKTIPGHSGFDPDCVRPNYQHCAGHHAMKGKALHEWMRLAETFPA